MAGIVAAAQTFGREFEGASAVARSLTHLESDERREVTAARRAPRFVCAVQGRAAFGGIAHDAVDDDCPTFTFNEKRSDVGRRARHALTVGEPRGLVGVEGECIGVQQHREAA